MAKVWKTKVDKKAEKAKDERHVRSWFVVAKKHGMCGINLYFPAYDRIFGSICEEIQVMGNDSGMVLFEGDLYRLASGCGDCEENLVYIGPAKYRGMLPGPMMDLLRSFIARERYAIKEADPSEVPAISAKIDVLEEFMGRLKG